MIFIKILENRLYGGSWIHFFMLFKLWQKGHFFWHIFMTRHYTMKCFNNFCSKITIMILGNTVQPRFVLIFKIFNSVIETLYHMKRPTIGESLKLKQIGSSWIKNFNSWNWQYIFWTKVVKYGYCALDILPERWRSILKPTE